MADGEAKRLVIGDRSRLLQPKIRIARCGLLTEQEISRTWRTLFRGTGSTDEALAKAEQLLEELRPESPLRHRLGSELDELRERTRQEA